MKNDIDNLISKIDSSINLLHLCIVWMYGCLAGMGVMYVVMS